MHDRQSSTLHTDHDKLPSDKALLAAFEDAGFSIQEGKFELSDILTLCEEGKMAFANGNNAANPYFAAMFPMAPGQSAENEVTDAEGYGRGFRVGKNEAIVMIGETPPEMQYFSFAAFVASTHWEGKPAPEPVIRPLPGTHLRTILVADRQEMFFCVGDTLNNLSLKTPAGVANPSVSAFGQRFLIVFTADAVTDGAVRDAASGAGYPVQAINTKVLPVDIARLGVERDADTFTIVQRLALDGNPVHDERAEAYKKHPTVRVFRLTPPSGVAPRPLPLPALRVRGTGRTELNHWPAVLALREAILRAYPDHEAKELMTSIWINESYELLQQGVDALGESRDTSYLSTESFVLPEDPDAFVVVYGVNHAASGKAVYSNVVAYGEAKDNGVASLNSREMAGSAGRYLPRADASALYAVTVSRFQGAAPCLKVPLPTPGHALHGILPSEAMYLGFRAYLEPETMVGPAWQEMVFDRAILFARKRR